MKTSRKTTAKAGEEAMILDSFLRFAERGDDELARYLLHCGIDHHDIDAAGDIPSAILAHYRRPSGATTSMRQPTIGSAGHRS
jgi:hypothetical protein